MAIGEGREGAGRCEGRGQCLDELLLGRGREERPGQAAHHRVGPVDATFVQESPQVQGIALDHLGRRIPVVQQLARRGLTSTAR